MLILVEILDIDPGRPESGLPPPGTEERAKLVSIISRERGSFSV